MRLIRYLLLALLTLASLPGLLHAQSQALELTPRIEVSPPAVRFPASVDAWLQTHKIIKVGVWGASQPPISLGIERGQLAGVDADYLALLESTLNVHFELYHYRSRDEAIAALNRGDVCMLAIWTPALWSQKSVQASLPWLVDRAVMVARAGDTSPPPAAAALMTLQGQSLPGGADYPSEFRNYYQAINDVAFGQTASAGFSHATASYLTRNNSLENIWLLPHPSVGELNLTFGVPAGEPQLLRAINDVLHNLPLVSRLRIAQGWGLESANVLGQRALDLSPEEAHWQEMNPVVSVIMDARREPISFINQQGKPAGLAIEVLNQISDHTGLQFHYQIAWNDDDLTALYRRFPQAVLASSISVPGESEASQPALATGASWLVSPAVLVMKRNAAQPASLHDLSGERIAIERNNPLRAWLETWYPTLQLIPTDSLQEALQQVSRDQVHGAVGSQFAVQYQLKRHNADRLYQALSLPVKPFNFSFAAQQADAPALGLLNKALSSLPPETLMKLASSWRDTLPPPDQESTPYVSPTGVATTMLLALIVVLLVAWWIGKLRHSMDGLRERLNSNQALILQLQEAKAENDRVLEARNAFMKSMGHEVRTPLNAIIGLLELELEALHQRKQHNENLQTVYESACSLLSITGDVFDIFRAEARDEQSSIRVVNLPSLLRSTVALFQQQAEEKGLQLTESVDLTTPRVEFDPLLIIRILSSLLRNAIKHSDGGEIRVSLRQGEPDSQGQLPLMIDVSDQGNGLLQSQWHDLRERPVPEDDPRVWADTGFSLAACQRMANAAGATLRVESEQGKGNTVSLHFSADPLRERTSVELPSEEAPLKVLIIDDYPPARMLLSQQVKKQGCDVLTANDGLEGLALWQQHHQEIGLVITDCTMPEMDGFELCRTIRAAEASKQLAATPIYALTAMSSFDAAEDCQSAGMNACFTKPLAPERLHQLLARHQPSRQDPQQQYGHTLEALMLARTAQNPLEMARQADRLMEMAMLADDAGLENYADRFSTLCRQQQPWAVIDERLGQLVHLIGTRREAGNAPQTAALADG